MRLAIIVAMISTACGSVADDKPAIPTGAAPVQVGASENVRESDPLPKALYVADAAGLPDCTAERYGELAYVVASKTFEACQGEWTVVTIEIPAGARGADGASGRDGTNGRDGIDGSNGKDGATGAQGIAGPAGKDMEVDTASWLDPITKKRWLKSPSARFYTEAVAACAGDGWSLASAEFFSAAWDHGLVASNPAPPTGGINSAWVADANGLNVGQHFASSVLDGRLNTQFSDATALAVYCVSEQ
jgi:hypothetical protein